MENKSGVRNAIPAKPKRDLAFTIILLRRVNFLVVVVCSCLRCSFFFLILATILSLIKTNVVTPVNPPRQVTVTASKKEKPIPKAIGTAPNTNLTVLNKKTDTISHHEFNCAQITFLYQKTNRRHHLNREQYRIVPLILHQPHRTKR